MQKDAEQTKSDELPFHVMHILFRWGGWAGIALSLYLLVGNVVFYVQSQQAVGVVMTTERGDRSPGTQSFAYFPVVSFNLPDGRTVEFQSKFGHGELLAYQTGDEVPVWYVASNPDETAKVASYFDLFGFPFLMFVFGGVFWVCGKLVQFVFR